MASIWKNPTRQDRQTKFISLAERRGRASAPATGGGMNPATIDQQRVEKIARRAGRLPVHVAVCEINKLHAEIITAARMSLDNAIRIGKLLTEVKGQLSHGEWLPWIKKNLPFDRATAANYMRVFDRREELDCKKVLHLTDAYRLLAGPPRCPLVPSWAKPAYPRERFEDVFEVVALAASALIQRGAEVTPEQCVELYFLLMENRLRINEAGQGEIYDDDAWRPIPSDA
ncbi:MAG: DUF3102 domain-containing protein [Limisphaerales bacterium]